MKTISHRSFINTAGVVVFVVFSMIVLSNGARVSMSYDDSYNASVAKNISLGLGYASTYHTIEPFDPAVTTGPTLLVPAALVMKAFGNTPWAPNVATAVVTLLMLVLVLHQASRRLHLSFGLLALSCIPPITILVQLAEGWSRLRGDVLAAELIVLGALILPFEPASSCDRAVYLRRIVTAGVVLGLAALTKFLAFACIAAIAVVFFVGLLAQNHRDYRAAGAALLVLGAGVLIPNVLFEFVRFVSLGGFSGYLQNLVATLLANAGQEPSMAQILLGQFEYTERFGKISQALQAWLNYVSFHRHPAAGSLLLLGWAAFSAWGLSVTKPANRMRLIALAMAGSGLMVLFFIVFVALIASRLQLGACVLSLFVGFATAEWANAAMDKRERTTFRSLSRYSPALPLSLMALYSVFWLFSFTSTSRPVWAAERISVADTSAAMLAIRASDPHATFCGLGWLVPRVLEYALPGTLWFRDCRLLLQEPGPAAAPRAVYLVRESWSHEWKAEAAEKEFARQCDTNTVYDDRAFRISRCPAGTVFAVALSP